MLDLSFSNKTPVKLFCYEFIKSKYWEEHFEKWAYLLSSWVADDKTDTSVMFYTKD